MPRTELSGEEIFDASLTEADMSGSILDGTPSTPSLRTLGTGSNQAAAGDDPRFFTVGGGDPYADYALLNPTGTLPNARVLSGGVGINLVDTGDGGSATFDLSLVVQDGINLVTGSQDEIIIAAPRDADPSASYIVVSSTGSLSGQRVLSGGIGVNLVDGGAGGSINVDLTLQSAGGVNITTGSAGVLVISASVNTDHAVRVSSDDTTTSYLDDKFVVTGVGISKSVLSPGANEQLQVAITTATPLTLTPDLPNAEGTGSSLARYDHIHNVPADVVSTLTPDLTNAEGTSASFARSDHVHNVPTDVPSSLGAGGSNDAGVSSSFSRADHTHRIDDPTSYVSATDQVSTTSTTFVTIPNMYVFPGSGTYVVTFSSYGTTSENYATGHVSLYVNSSYQANSFRAFDGASRNQYPKFPVHTQGKFVLTGSGESISARYRIDGGGSIVIKERSLLVQRVDS